MPRRSVYRLDQHPSSPRSRKVVCAVLLRGDPVELVTVDVGPADGLDRVPVLHTDQGTLWEATTILEWLEERERVLLPPGTEHAARHWDRVGDRHLLDVDPSDPRAWLRAGATLEVIATRLADGREFLCGDPFTLADLGPAIGAEELRHAGLALPPPVEAWLERCLALGPLRDQVALARALR